jgi:peptidoglycan/LPS O-acetylase OafA/YrhL
MWHHCTVFTAQPGSAFEHAYAVLTSMGVCGVDLFFVLSGFLITGILADAKSAPGQTLGGYLTTFYARRTLRIFPLYYAVVALCFIVLPHAGDVVGLVSHSAATKLGEKLARYAGSSEHQAWYWLYLSNFLEAREANWVHPILGVSWSLAIEEQFYLLWPLILWVLPRRGALGACAVMVVAALALRSEIVLDLLRRGWVDPDRLYPPYRNPMGAYTLTMCRCDQLALGALLALLLRSGVTLQRAARVALPVFLITLPATVAVYFTEVYRGRSNEQFGENFSPGMLTYGMTLTGLAAASGLVLALTARPGGPAHALWTGRFLRTFGKYAYALYLFHLPLRAAIRDLVFGPAPTGPAAAGPGPKLHFFTVAGSQLPAQALFYALAFAAALIAAWLSWRLFESPLLSLKRFFPTPYERR